MNSTITIKIATELWELEEVCRLNHQVFAEEIGQHSPSDSGLLIDKFHSENQYIICLIGQEIVGMMALRDVRPFSLDSKLENIDQYLPPHDSLCEIRLLSIKPQYRSTQLCYRMFKEAFVLLDNKKYDYVVISGILSQQKLYRSLGFVPFGPLVGDAVKFQPMYNSKAFFSKSRHNKIDPATEQKRINLLPGPIDVHLSVAAEFQRTSESHRSDAFSTNYDAISKSLCQFVNARHVQVLTGSATLANEIMLAHISTFATKGLILSNGEFGDRIVHQANCQKLEYIEYKVAQGEDFELSTIEHLLDINRDIRWIYFVHCETSTGIVNDMQGITALCKQRNVLVFADCVSTFGIVPLDLSTVYMAAASSGKAIGSYSGLAIIYYNQLIEDPTSRIPVYLNIFHYIKKGGIPFTLNSNALYALGAAVETIDIDAKYQTIVEQSDWLRTQLLQLGLNLDPFNGTALHPAIISIQLPRAMSSVALGVILEKQQILINYNSDYLIRHNRIQLCMFSKIEESELKQLVSVFREMLKPVAIQY